MIQEIFCCLDDIGASPLFTQFCLGVKDSLDEVICKYEISGKPSFGMGVSHETQAEHTLCILPWVLLGRMWA